MKAVRVVPIWGEAGLAENKAQPLTTIVDRTNDYGCPYHYQKLGTARYPVVQLFKQWRGESIFWLELSSGHPDCASNHHRGVDRMISNVEKSLGALLQQLGNSETVR